MARCPYLEFDLPDNDEHNRSQGKFYCKLDNDRLHQETLAHFCSCSYDDKFVNCETYKKFS